MSLYKKYRPKSLNDVYGNSTIVTSLEKVVKKKTIPQVILFTGPTGCGKTTLARILAKELSAERSLIEMDSAQFTGIDVIRDIRKKSRFKPVGGGSKVFIMDECFSEDTLIQMHDKTTKRIKDIKVGNVVNNLHKTGKVTNTFIKKIALSRIVRIKFSNNKILYCSDAHLFMTKNGWTKARELQSKFVFLNNSSNLVLLNTNKRSNDKNKKNKMQRVWCFIAQTKKVLQSNLYKSLQWKKKKENSNKDLPNLQKEIRTKSAIRKKINLWFSLWKYFSRTKENRKKTNKKIPQGNVKEREIFCENNKRKRISQIKFKKNEKSKPYAKKEVGKKSNRNKKKKWNFTYLERKTWWKRILYGTTNNISKTFKLGNGNSNPNERKKRWELPYKLQSRYWKSKKENSNRSRWEGTQYEKEQTERLEERKEISRIRVESVEIYKQGDNEESFKSIIKDKEKNQGYVNLYDIEVDSHHSYFANDILVHNCHAISTQAQDAFLKELEDTPNNVYYFLCTTNPEKLKTTLKGRCITYQLGLLSTSDMGELLLDVVKKEKEKVDSKVYKSIISNAKGHPRNALNILEQVLSVSDKKRLKIAKNYEIEENQSIELCRSLLKNEGFKAAQTILKGLKNQNAESIRRHILGYCQSVLLGNNYNGSHQSAARLVEEFSETTYDMGFTQIIIACYAYYHSV